jgi:hypothetical protein
MSICEINDVREATNFKGVSFSNFKKTDVIKELLNSLQLSKIEQACYWSAELICSAHFSDLWETIILFYCKYIQLGNPKVAIYLELRINNFKEIVNNGYTNFELRLRNNEKIRNLFFEIIFILCNCNRKHKFEPVKLTKTDFDMTTMIDRFKATNVLFAQDIFLKEDPKEIYIAINELTYSLSKEGKNTLLACYWIEWIIEFDNKSKSAKEKCICERRNYKVDPKFQKNIIWIVWDIILNESNNKSKVIQKIIKSLLNIFTLRYLTSCNKKRRYIFYFCVSLLIDPVDTTNDIIKCEDKNTLNLLLSKIDIIYSQIKKNEISPQTDYLFKDLKKNHLEDTISKLEKMNNFEEEFIPRI